MFQNYSYGVELFKEQLTHWGQVTYICVGTHTDIGSDNGLLPVGAKPLSEPMMEYC